MVKKVKKEVKAPKKTSEVVDGLKDSTDRYEEKDATEVYEEKDSF